jgi:hypothetical protein
LPPLPVNVAYRREIGEALYLPKPLLLLGPFVVGCEWVKPLGGKQ